jgi:hypothetical protein
MQTPGTTPEPQAQGPQLPEQAPIQMEAPQANPAENRPAVDQVRGAVKAGVNAALGAAQLTAQAAQEKVVEMADPGRRTPLEQGLQGANQMINGPAEELARAGIKAVKNGGNAVGAAVESGIAYVKGDKETAGEKAQEALSGAKMATKAVVVDASSAIPKSTTEGALQMGAASYNTAKGLGFVDRAKGFAKKAQNFFTGKKKDDQDLAA